MVKFTTSLHHWFKYIKFMHRGHFLKRRVDLLLSRVPDGVHFLCLLSNLKGRKKSPIHSKVLEYSKQEQRESVGQERFLEGCGDTDKASI